jgi:MFS family permease
VSGARAASAFAGWGVVRRRSFGPYLVGNFVSNCGTWVQNLAQAVLVFRLTGSTFLVGVVGFAQFAAILVLAPWTGSAADRFDRRRLIIATQAAAIVPTLGLGLLSLAGAATVPVVVIVALLVGIATAFAAPAMGALVPDLVETSELRPAVALNSFTFGAGRAIGPVVGAALVSVSVSVAFLANSLSYLALIGALLISKPIHRGARSGDARASSFRAGLAVVRASRVLVLLLLTVATIAIAADPILTLGPAFAEDVLAQPDSFAGILGGAFGAGAMIATLVVARRRTVDDGPVAATVIAMVIAGVAFAMAPNATVAVVALFAMGTCFSAANALATTSVQLHTPPETRGRVMALWSVAFLGVRPFASLADGALATIVGLRAAAVAMTLPALVVAFALRRGLPRTAQAHGRDARGVG